MIDLNRDFELALPTPHQQIFAVIAAVSLLAFIVFLVRRRTIREEYSLLWMLTGVGILILTLWKDLLKILVIISGVGLASSVVFLSGILFVLLICMHLSAIVSRQRTMIKDLSIRLAILDSRLARMSASRDGNMGERRAVGPQNQNRENNGKAS